MIEHLPRGSSLARELHGEAADWTPTDYLLAVVVDHLAVANWLFTMVHRDEDAQEPEYPAPIPRPGAPASLAEPEPRLGASSGQIAAFFAR